jgi:hypothetical protein
MFDTLKKIPPAILGFILYPLVTLAVALVHFVGFACLVLAAVLLFPSFISSVIVSFDAIRQQNSSGMMPERSFFSELARDLGLRAAAVAIGGLALALYAVIQTIVILASPFDGIKTGFQGGFSGVLSGIQNKLFNHFGFIVFINSASAQNPQFLPTIQALMQNRGVNLGQVTLSEAPLTDQEINPLTYRLNQAQDNEGYNHAVDSWTHKLSNAEEATCCISMDVPEKSNIVLLQQQYFHNSTWHPIDNQTSVFSHNSLTHHLKNRNSLNPLNRANLRDTVSKHTHAEEACDTRWRIIPFCAQDSTLVSKLQALRAAEQINEPTEPRARPEVATSTSNQLYRLFTTINPFQTPTPAPDVPNERGEYSLLV